MIKYIFLTLLALSQNTFAQDCGEVKDGAVNRLDAPGKSLENGKVQDQDGLGTCYANTASLLLQSVIPNNPEISYLQLAVNHGENVVLKKMRADGHNNAFKGNGDLVLEAGFTCEAIDNARKNGGVCRREDVALEKMIFNDNSKQYFDKNSIQLDLLKKVSTYYDGILSSFGANDLEKAKNAKMAKPKKGEVVPLTELTKYDEYTLTLKDTIDKNREKYALASCKKVDTGNAIKVSSDVILRLKNKLTAKTAKPSLISEMTMLQYKMGTPYSYKFQGNDIYEPNLSATFKTNLQSNYLDRLTNAKPAASGVAAYKEMLLKTYPSAKNAIDEVIKELTPENKSSLEADYKRYVLKDYSECTAPGLIAYMKNDDGLVKDFSGVGCNSDYLKHVKNLQQMVVGLDGSNFNNMEKLNYFLENIPKFSYEQAMLQLVAPTCSPERKLKIPDDVNCRAVTFSYPGGRIDDAATEEKNLVKMRKDFIKHTKRNIDGNAPMGLSLCTRFFDPTETNNFYNKTGECDSTKKHGFHAVTMIGYKCTAGKLKYLIQNSWGAWDSAEPKFEKDSHGKAWMEEDDVIKNTYQLDLLK